MSRGTRGGSNSDRSNTVCFIIIIIIFSSPYSVRSTRCPFRSPNVFFFFFFSLGVRIVAVANLLPPANIIIISENDCPAAAQHIFTDPAVVSANENVVTLLTARLQYYYGSRYFCIFRTNARGRQDGFSRILVAFCWAWNEDVSLARDETREPGTRRFPSDWSNKPPRPIFKFGI